MRRLLGECVIYLRLRYVPSRNLAFSVESQGQVTSGVKVSRV